MFVKHIKRNVFLLFTIFMFDAKIPKLKILILSYFWDTLTSFMSTVLCIDHIPKFSNISVDYDSICCHFLLVRSTKLTQFHGENGSQ